MVEITSSLGKTHIESKSPGHRKVLSVPNSYNEELENDAPPIPGWTPVSMQPGQEVRLSAEEFRSFQNKKNELQKSQKFISPEAKARLEALIGIGRLTAEVKIDEYTFKLQTLKSSEHRAISNLLQEPVNGFEQRLQVLSRSLLSINDYSIKDVLGEISVYEFLEEMQESVVNKLFSEYLKLWAKAIGDSKLEEMSDNLKK